MKINKILTEASGLDPVEKMRLLDIGTRESNVGAMSDSKLLANQKICLAKGYKNALYKIETEMIHRDLITDYTELAKTSKSTEPEGTKKSAFSADEIIDKLIDKFLLPGMLDFSEYKVVKKLHSTSDIINLAVSKKDAMPKLLIFLIYSIFSNMPEISKGLKDYLILLKFITMDELKKLILKCSENKKIVDTLAEFYTKFEALDESLKEDIEKHTELNPKLWAEKTLKPEVKEKIGQIADEFLNSLKEDDITLKVKNIILVGSNCNYNYTKDSDLDIHIIAENIEAPEDLYTKIYSAYRSIFNKKLDIDFYGIPVEIYIETDEMPRISNGCYSVMNDEWIKEPIIEDIPEIDQEAFDKEFKIWEDRYNKIIADAKEELKEDINDTNKVSNNRGKNMERNFSNFDDAIDALNEINDEEEVKEVVDDTEEVEADEKVADNNCIAKTANDVMVAYQNAARWLDTIKETVYFRLNSPVLANYIHELAHKMPSEFDSFGTILHTSNMEIPYPATEELEGKPKNIVEAIDATLSILDAIRAALNAFIKCTDEDYHGMSCSAEELLVKIESEYPMLYRLLENAKKYADDTITFEKYVLALVEHKDELLD